MTDPDRVAEWERVPSEVELAEMLEQARRPGLLLRKEAHSTDQGLPGCWLGGEPTLPPDIPWPMIETEDPEYPEGPDGLPMHFIGQIDLEQMPSGQDLPELPEVGTLFFFYDPVCGPSYDPFNGFERVIYVAHDVSVYPPRAMPKMPNIQEFEQVTGAYRRNPSHGYKKWPFQFSPFDGHRLDEYHNRVFQERVVDGNLKLKQQLKVEMETRSVQGESNACRVFANHHIFGSNAGSEPDGDFVRLLAVKHDRDIGFDFAGNWVVFWIRREDLKASVFENSFVYGEL